MRHNKLVRNIVLGIFIFPFLISCAPKSSQLFFFESYNNLNDDRTYYVADLYTPSKIERLNNVKCITPPDVAIISEPIWSPNGKYYSCSFPSAFYVNTIDTKTQAELQNDAWEFESWSPDSQYFTLGYTGGLVSRQYMELAMMKYDGTGLTQLVNKAGYEIYISSYWSPNKKYIAYPTVIAISGSADIYLVIIDSKGEEIYKFDLQQLTKDKGVDPTSFNWSPDSKKLTFLGSYNMETPKEGWYILDIESGKISSPIPAGVDMRMESSRMVT